MGGRQTNHLGPGCNWWYISRMMARLFADTSLEAEAVMIELHRKASGRRKLEIVGELYDTNKLLALGGLCERHPQASERELRRRLAGLLLGEELAEKVYGPLETGDVKP